MDHTHSQFGKQSTFAGQPVDHNINEQEYSHQPAPSIPVYLKKTYWWAYIRPGAVAFFEKQWVINLILWGNFRKLRDMALNEMGPTIHGRTLQIACVYGDFSVKLARRIPEGGWLDIVDVLPIQLDNVLQKLPLAARVRAIHSDSRSLQFADDDTYDQAVMFFLLHEMPVHARKKTLYEALRVIKPKSKLVILDYHKPSSFHPLRYLFPPVYKLLEPFALDLWNQELEAWLPENFIPTGITKETMFGGLYQKVIIMK